MVNNLHDLRKKLEQASTEQLRTMLQTEVAKETPDDDLVLLVLNILEERDKEKPVELTKKEKAAWKRYQKRVRSRAGKPMLHLGRITAVAASLLVIVGLLFAAMPQEAKAGSLFDVLASWTDSIFEFFNAGTENSLVNYEFKTSNAGLQQLRDTVVEYGGTERAIPMWIPEENELISLEVDEVTNKTTVSAVFRDEIGTLVIKTDIYDTAAPREFYKNLESPEEWELYGNFHYVVQNREQWSAAWAKDNTECFITVECQEDVLDRILKSIYVMEEE